MNNKIRTGYLTLMTGNTICFPHSLHVVISFLIHLMCDRIHIFRTGIDADLAAFAQFLIDIYCHNFHPFYFSGEPPFTAALAS